MGYVNRDEIVRLVSKYTGFTISDTREMVDAYSLIVERMLREGHSIKFGNLGKFRLKDMDAKSERKGWDPYKKKSIIVSAKPAYKKPDFCFSKAFKNEIREKSEGGGL